MRIRFSLIYGVSNTLIYDFSKFRNVVELKVKIPDELWFRFKQEIRARYGRFKGLVPQAVIEAIELWIQIPSESIPKEIKHKASPTKVLSTMPIVFGNRLGVIETNF